MPSTHVDDINITIITTTTIIIAAVIVNSYLLMACDFLRALATIAVMWD